jgi:hypothetical protein
MTPAIVNQDKIIGDATEEFYKYITSSVFKDLLGRPPKDKDDIKTRKLIKRKLNIIKSMIKSK